MFPRLGDRVAGGQGVRKLRDGVDELDIIDHGYRITGNIGWYTEAHEDTVAVEAVSVGEDADECRACGALPHDGSCG